MELDDVIAILVMLLCFLGMGICGGIERGTIPFPM